MHRQRPTIPLARTVPLFAIPSKAAETAIQAAESSGLASAAQHKAEQNAQTAKAMEKQMDAYAKARLALLKKKAYKAQADTTGV